MIRPGLIDDYVIYKYRLSEIVEPIGNEVLVGFNKNHIYLLVFDKDTGTYQRADSGTDVEFTTISDVKTVSRGIFLRFSNASDDAISQLKTSFLNRQKYMTCSQAVCRVLAGAGIRIGNGASVDTSYQLIEHLIKDHVQISDPNVVFDVFTLDPRGIDTQFDEAKKLSKMNEEVRQKSIKGFLIVTTGLAKTFSYWFFSSDGG